MQYKSWWFLILVLVMLVACSNEQPQCNCVAPTGTTESVAVATATVIATPSATTTATAVTVATPTPAVTVVAPIPMSEYSLDMGASYGTLVGHGMFKLKFNIAGTTFEETQRNFESLQASLINVKAYCLAPDQRAEGYEDWNLNTPAWYLIGLSGGNVNLECETAVEEFLGYDMTANIPTGLLKDLQGAESPGDTYWIYEGIADDAHFIGIWDGPLPTLPAICFEQSLQQLGYAGKEIISVNIKATVAEESVFTKLHRIGATNVPREDYTIPDLCNVGQLHEIARPLWIQATMVDSDEILVTAYDSHWNPVQFSLHLDPEKCNLYTNFEGILFEMHFQNEDGDPGREPYYSIQPNGLIYIEINEGAEYVYLTVKDGKVVWLKSAGVEQTTGPTLPSIAVIYVSPVVDTRAPYIRQMVEEVPQPYLLDNQVITQSLPIPFISE